VPLYLTDMIKKHFPNDGTPTLHAKRFDLQFPLFAFAQRRGRGVSGIQ